MDKSTCYMDISIRELSALRAAIESFMDALSNRPAFFANALPASRAKRLRSGTTLQPRFSLHTHPHAELTHCVQGRARLFLNDRSVVLPSTSPLLIPPEVVHAEGTYGVGSADRPYALLWCIFLPTAVTFFLSTYPDPPSFGPAGRKIMLTSDMAGELSRVALTPDLANNRRARTQFHSLLLQACLDALASMDKSPRQEMSYHQAMVAQIMEYLRVHYDRPIAVSDLARLAHCTPNYLNTMFRRTIGVPIHRFLLDHRLKLAKEWLSDRTISVKQVAYQVGFTDPLYFSRLFRKRFGVSPLAFRGKGRSAE